MWSMSVRQGVVDGLSTMFVILSATVVLMSGIGLAGSREMSGIGLGGWTTVVGGAVVTGPATVVSRSGVGCREMTGVGLGGSAGTAPLGVAT